MGIPHPVEPGRIPALCARLGALLSERDIDLVVCDLSDAVSPNAATVEALARLLLVAKRHGRRFQLLHPCEELLNLLAMMGLDEVLRLESSGEPEQREQHGGVEEEGDAAQPLA